MIRLRYIFQQISFEVMEAKKNTTRMDRLIELQNRAQMLWARENVFKADPDPAKPKYFETFPYPYMNGKLHLGHGFSLSKCEFNARYKKMTGYNVLFPFGFHCTGMPICASAQKLKQELETYGNPPKFTEEALQKYKEKKAQPQYQILKDMDIPDELIKEFTNPQFWCSYFPPFGKTDLRSFGVYTDLSRSFITTQLNPYYDKFVSWQFTQLKAGDYIKFGKRPSIYSVKDQQICADHDRSEGEGVAPQQYTLVKIRVLECNEALKKAGLQGKKVFLAAATLRPETMYGQTNCFVLPTGQYGAFQMRDDEIFICSQRSARNMSYQGLTKTQNTVNVVASFTGEQLLGLPLKAPLSKYQKVYCLPMMTISMGKGTGVVTSVPSDSPDDYAALMDLKNKKAFREKFRLTDQMVDFMPVEIINVPTFGNLIGVKLCQDFKIKGQNDKELLAKAKQLSYNKGFYEGVMLMGQYTGKKVQEAKALVKKDLLQTAQAVTYFEPDGMVVSRSGDQCVVTFIDQWYLNYADQQWKQKVMSHVVLTLKTNNQATHNQFVGSVDWIHEWACSRSFGLGTRLPFDDRYLIESLSDSTIYMAYYTIAHFLQGDLEGKTPGLFGIKSSQITDDVFDYIFLGKPYNKATNIQEAKLKIMKDQFEYWYPVDLRCSGKDLIKNHLTMSLFIHTAIWPNQPERWPRMFFCNGYVLVNGQKMSKSKGNFKVLGDISREYGADAIRYACADAGDTLDDANFTFQNVNSGIMMLSTIEMYLGKVTEHYESYRTGESEDKETNYFDRVFWNSLLNNMAKIRTAYDEMKYRDVIKYAVHEMNSIKDEYLLNLENEKPRKDFIETWIYWQLLVLSPICPHFADIVYLDFFVPMVGFDPKYPKYLSEGQLPQTGGEKIDYGVIKSFKGIKAFLSSMRDSKEKASKSKKKEKQPPKFSKATILYRKDYQPYQLEIFKVLSSVSIVDNKPVQDWKAKLTIQDKDLKIKAFTFGSSVLKDYQVRGTEALQSVLPYDQKQILSIFHLRIVREFGTSIKIIQIGDLKTQEKLWLDAAANVNPGKPLAIFQL